MILDSEQERSSIYSVLKTLQECLVVGIKGTLSRDHD
jgi:hypothetical protein